MPKVDNIRLKLRSIFRYVYFAFAALAVTVLAMLAIWAFQGQPVAVLFRSLSEMGAAVAMVVLLLGLSVPMFFAGWLLLGAVILGPRAEQPPFLDGVGD